MKKLVILSAAAFLLCIKAYSQNTKVLEDGGTGPLKAIVVGEKTLPNHAVYRPADLSKIAKLPVMVWGNGGCANSSEGHQNFLNEIASHGYIIVAIGPFIASGEKMKEEDRKIRTTSANLLEGLDWLMAQNIDKNSPYYQKVDLSNTAVAGMSCGGLQTIEAAGDSRFKTVMVMNSGVLNGGASSGMPGMPAVTKEKLNSLHTPTLYVIGDSTDIAYNNAMDDFKLINHVPIVMSNLNVGHGGTYNQPHGGAFSPLVLKWLDWQLKGKTENAKLFVGQNCYWCGKDGWRIETKNFR